MKKQTPNRKTASTKKKYSRPLKQGPVAKPVSKNVRIHLSLYPMRLNKRMALLGMATRRDADALILAGHVYVNGEVADLGDRVKEQDTIAIGNDRRIKENRYILYYKPTGVTTHRERDAKSILQATNLRGVFPIGRLDKDSEGLILLTNDGRVTDRLLSPKYGHEKEYQVRVRAPLTHQFMAKLRDGVQIDSQTKTKSTQIRRIDKHTFDIILREGKNRQIRRMVGSLGNEVIELTRFRIMNISIDHMKPGQYRDLSQEERETMLNDLGLE